MHVMCLHMYAFEVIYGNEEFKANCSWLCTYELNGNLSLCRAKLVSLVDDLDSGIITWDEFEKQVKKSHSNRVGGPSNRQPGELPKLEDNFYANPMPGCICQEQQLNRKLLKEGV